MTTHLTQTTARPTTAPARDGGLPHTAAQPSDASGRRTLSGVGMMLTSAVSNQFGAAVGSTAFDAIGPIGVVAIRQIVGAAVLMPTVRPPLHRFTRAQWWPILLLGVVFVTMNLSLYTAVDRLGLGLAVTLEFLGPLGVALASSRRGLDLLCALAAFGGVWILVMPGPSSDLIGIGAGLLGAASWASYILLNRTIGRRTQGLQGAAAATLVAATMTAPVVVIFAVQGRFTPAPLIAALVAGLFCSAVPYVLDLVAIRRVPIPVYSVFMSLSPVIAVLAGLVILHQVPVAHEWVGVGIIVAVNAAVTGLRRRPSRRLPLLPG
ncbi:MAG: EamA family transporter [Mycetocola sp.]